MRADRLISLIMLLQARGRQTARALANELGVSERTIYRDMLALSSAGVPVYGEAGLEGGYSLIDSYHTNLTGLTSGEVRALFMLKSPGPLAALGIDHDLQSAWRKLAAALPESRRSDEARIQQRFYLDTVGWRQTNGALPHLHTLHQAVWQDRRVLLAYRPIGNVTVDQMVEPYGLVVKAGAWYLVDCLRGKFGVHEVNELVEVQLLPESFERQPDFDLVAFWSEWRLEVEQSFLHYPVSLLVAPHMQPWLRHALGENMLPKQQPNGGAVDGWVRLDLRFASLEDARNRLLALGGGVEVIAPQALRLSLRDYANQILARYTRLSDLAHSI